MAARYDLYKNPEPGRKSLRPRLHARIVPSGTTQERELAEEIHARCTLTTADVLAVLTSLSQVVVERLQQGERIHLHGLGYFQMTLQCPAVRSEKEIRAESIRFKSVAFRPDVELKEQLATTRFERARDKHHSQTHTDEAADTRLADYLAEHGSISRLDFQRLMHYTQATACRVLRKWVEAGKLKKEGLPRFPVYVANTEPDGSV